LKPLVGGDLTRVVFVSYGNPTTRAAGTPCPGGLDGFDIHPAFGIDAERMRRVAGFVAGRFLPVIKALATCAVCQDPSVDRMTFVDTHQSAFAEHGLCARAETDPAFDTECFSASGQSFHNDPVQGATRPLICERSVSEFRP